MTSRLSRRSFLAGIGTAASLVATGCTLSTSTDRDVELGADGTLRILNWADYIDPTDGDVAGTIQRASSSVLSIDYVEGYEDNIAAWETIIEPALSDGRSTGYDIIVPTYWLAARMAERGWLQQIPIERIPNHVNIDPAFLTQSWDRGARLNMPWQAGITGIAYDPAVTGREITSIRDLFDPEFRGRTGVITEMREAVGFAMLVNGDDPSAPTEESANRAIDFLEQQRDGGQIGRFTGPEFSDGLASGELALAMAWSGDIVQLQVERPDIRFVIPDEGAIQWFDTMVIPQGSELLGSAASFMNFVYDPLEAAQITAYVQYVSPVIGVQDALRAAGEGALADDPILFPDDETKRRLFTWGLLDTATELRIESRFAELIA